MHLNSYRIYLFSRQFTYRFNREAFSLLFSLKGNLKLIGTMSYRDF